MQPKRILFSVMISWLGLVSLVLALGSQTNTALARVASMGGISSANIVTVTVTLTPTAIPVASPTMIPTPSYPSAQDIRNALSEDFARIENTLTQANSQPSGPTVRDNLISSFIYDLLKGCLVALGGLILTKIVVWLGLKRTTSRGKTPGQTAVKLNSVLTGVVIACAVVFVILLAAALFTPSAFGQPDLTVVTQKLDRIETQLQMLTPLLTPGSPGQNAAPAQAPDPFADLKPFLVPLLVISLCGNVALVFAYSRRRADSDVTAAQVALPNLTGALDRDVLNAILLALILLLLPYPADALILPFIVQFFILAVLSIVRLYPSLRLKQFIARHYSLLIFLAVFGAWLGFFEFIRQLVYPVWDVARASIYQYSPDISRDLVTGIDSALSAAPLLLSALLAFPGWWLIRRQAKTRAIPELEAAIDLEENQSVE